MGLELGFGIAQKKNDNMDLTVGVGDPHEPGYLRLYRTVYCGLFSIQVEEQRILANCSTDLLHSR